MPISEEEFKQALREAAGSEFDGLLPEEGGGHVFSERFERRMARHISSEAGGRRSSPLPGRLRPAAIAVILAAAMLAAACAIPKVRESVAGFFMQVFPDHMEVVPTELERSVIERVYDLDPIPEGFTLSKTMFRDELYFSIYSNEDDDTIGFHQYAGSVHASSFDNENADCTEYEIEGRMVLIRYSEDSSMAIWAEDGYIFALDFGSPVDLELFKTWIASVKPKGE